MCNKAHAIIILSKSDKKPTEVERYIHIFPPSDFKSLDHIANNWCWLCDRGIISWQCVTLVMYNISREEEEEEKKKQEWRWTVGKQKTARLNWIGNISGAWVIFCRCHSIQCWTEECVECKRNVGFKWHVLKMFQTNYCRDMHQCNNLQYVWVI